MSELYDTEPPQWGDYPWGLEELFGLMIGTGAVAVTAVIWFKKRFWSE